MKTTAYAGAALLAVALVLYPLTLVQDVYPLLLLGALGLIAFALALLSGEWVLVGPGMGVVMIEYTAALEVDDLRLDQLVPAAAVAALLLLELVDLISLITRNPAPDKEVIKQRARHIVASAMMAAAVSTAVLFSARAIGGGPVSFIAVGAAAGLGALVIGAVLARRSVEG